MEVPKNPYACAICQKRFDNPILLIKHVEFRHSSTKDSSKADNLKDVNQDPLETKNSKETTEEHFKYVAIQESCENIDSAIDCTAKNQGHESIGIDESETSQFVTNYSANSSMSKDNENFVEQSEIGPKPNSSKSRAIQVEEFSSEGTKLEWLLHKNQHTERILLNFGLSKVWHHLSNKKF